MTRVVVAASSGLGAQAGADVADAGGNAVDAAIAASVAGMCTDPGLIAPAAGAYLTVRPPEGPAVVFDANVAVPGLGRADAGSDFGETVSMEYGGGMTTRIGHRSVAVPGAFQGFGVVHEAFGAVDWASLIEPARRAVRHGFPLSAAAARYLKFAADPIFSATAASREALRSGGSLAEGTVLSVPGLEASLELIAAEGWRSWSTGTIAERIVDDMERNDGWVTREDLEHYEVVQREPIHVELDDWDIYTNPAPAIGGAILAAMLILHRSLDGDRHDAARFARIQRAVLRHRERHLDLADDRFAAVAELLEWASDVDRSGMGSGSTIHTSAVDDDGLACSITTSAGYGSGVMVPGTGLWLNNSLGEVELVPEGLSLRPGDRMPSNMAPTVAVGRGRIVSIGTPGASRITTALARVLMEIVDDDAPLDVAVGASRLHVEMFEGRPTVALEPDLGQGADFGDLVERRFDEPSMYFGGVQAAQVHGGVLAGVADHRRSGAVAVGGG